MKKLLLILMGLFMCVGCDKNVLEKKPDIELFESKVDYILFRDKKIYLTQNLEDYVLQFKGFSCKFQAPDSQITSDMSIDNINDKSHTFYSLSINSNYNNGYTEGYIRCHDDKGSGDNEFDVYLHAAEEKDEFLFVDMDILEWTIYPGFADEEIKIFINGKSLILESNDVSTKEDVIEVMGKDYEVKEGNFNNGYESYIYTIDGVEYDFSFDDDNELYKIEISID